MSGLADSPYNKTPLPLEIARVLTSEASPQTDGSTLLRAELAVPDLEPDERTLDLVIPAGELLVVRYLRRREDAELPLQERIDVIGGVLSQLPASKFEYSPPVAGRRRRRVGLKILDPARAKHEEQYVEYHRGNVGQGILAQLKPVEIVATVGGEQTIGSMTMRRVASRYAEMLGGLGLETRRQAVLNDIARMATLDYIQGIFEPETARSRIQDLYAAYD
jgi:hypothetical protein